MAHVVLNLATRREPSCRRSCREVDGRPGVGPGHWPTVFSPSSGTGTGAGALTDGPAPTEEASGAEAAMGSGPKTCPSIFSGQYGCSSPTGLGRCVAF